MKSTPGLRAVAVYEAAKGALVFIAGFGLLSLMQHDMQHFAEQLIAHLHLNPAKGYPRIFIDAATNVTNTRLWLLAGFALVYALVRWVEAIGLWLGKRWAEWFAVASGAIYVPAEVYGLVRGVTRTCCRLPGRSRLRPTAPRAAWRVSQALMRPNSKTTKRASPNS